MNDEQTAYDMAELLGCAVDDVEIYRAIARLKGENEQLRVAALRVFNAADGTPAHADALLDLLAACQPTEWARNP
jgi:hypothetical protein